jgi:hypothetical protein
VLVAASTGFLLTAGQAVGQSGVTAREAELSVPFGSASGTVVLVGDRLVFVDEERLDASFAIARDDIKAFEMDGELVTVTTRAPFAIARASGRCCGCGSTTRRR